MTMYPFLSGFWLSTGISTGIMSLLAYWHVNHRNIALLPPWFFAAVIAAIYITPMLGMWYAWRKFERRRGWEDKEISLRPCFTGAVAGGILIVFVAYLLLPAFLR